MRPIAGAYAQGDVSPAPETRFSVRRANGSEADALGDVAIEDE